MLGRLIVMKYGYCNAWCGLCIGSVFNVFYFLLLEGNHCSAHFYLRNIFFSLCVCLCVGLFVALALVCGMLNQNGNSAIGYQSTLPPENELNKNRRASSLELILSPMRESTLQRK